MKFKPFLKKNLVRIIIILMGGLAGFLYWRFIGCESGTCRIKSVWYWSTLYGLVFGFLLADLVSSYIIRKKKANTDDTSSAGGDIPSSQG